MATLTPSPKMQFFDSNGNPLSGGKLYTFAAGTTTPLATFTDSTGGTPNTNPIILNSRGEADVWLGSNLYYMQLKTSADVLIWSSDNIGGSATLAALAASGGSALVGFIQSGAGAIAGTVSGKLLSLEARPEEFGAVADGVTNDSAAILKALQTGKRVRLTDNATYLSTASVAYAANKIEIVGKGSTILFNGTGIGLDLSAVNNFLQTGRIHLDGFTVKTTNNDAKGTAYSTYTDQGIRLRYFHGSKLGAIQCQGFSIGLEADTCYHNDFSGVSSVSCYKGIIESNGANGNAWGATHAASSFDFSGGGGNSTFSGDVEPGSRTNYLGSGNRLIGRSRLERISLNIPINPWLEVGSDCILDELLMPFNSTAIQADGSFMVKVTGDQNRIVTRSPFVHRNGFLFELGANDNHLTLIADYNDNTNTGSTTYNAAKQWIIDYGLRNRLTVVSSNGLVDTVGSSGQSIIGDVQNKVQITTAAWTLTNVTGAKSSYLGPFGTPTEDLLVREYTVSGASPSIDTGTLYTANGSTIYSADCWVLIPTVDGVSSLELTAVSGQGGQKIDNRALGQWIRLWQVGLPANTQAVRLILTATGAVGKKFVVACPRVGPGYASGFTPPNSTASNVHLNSVASGKYTPTWSSSGGANNIGNGTLEGWYNKSGKMVTATVELSIGGTTTVSADYYSFTLPSSARADKGWNCTGSYYDASTSTSYVFSGYVVRAGSNNTVRLVVNGVAGSPYVSSTIPVVPAINDYLTFTIAYEEA